MKTKYRPQAVVAQELASVLLSFADRPSEPALRKATGLWCELVRNGVGGDDW